MNDCTVIDDFYADLLGIESDDLIPIAKPVKYADGDDKSEMKDILPDLDTFDNGYNFRIDLCSQLDTQLQYSESLNTLFVSPDKNFYIDITYTAKQNCSNLILRAIIVFKEDVGAPVRRCPTHCSMDKVKCEVDAELYNNIRVTNGTYSGKPDGEFLRERLNVKIPLSNVNPNSDNIIKQRIALRLLCPNSCIGRKSTAIIFTLETSTNDVLSKQILGVQVSKSPKRDKSNKEKSLLDRKRTIENIETKFNFDCPVKKKRIKKEFPESPMTPPPSVSPESDMLPPTSSYQTFGNRTALKLIVPNNLAIPILQDACNKMAGQMLETKTNCCRKDYDVLQKLIQDLRKEEMTKKKS